jgi:beta-lactam-binding protein with PASTA domain
VRIGQLRQVEVPDLFGLTEQEARDVLDDIGLELRVVGVVPNDDPELGNRVIGQEPIEGEFVDEGSEVEVQIGEVPSVPPTTGP